VLRQRVITALILAPIVVALLFLASATGFALGLAPILLLASVEWCRLAGVARPVVHSGYVLGLALLMGGCFYFPAAGEWLIKVALGWWLIALWAITGYPRRQPQWFAGPVAMLLAGPLLLVAPWFALYLLHAQTAGEWLVLFLLLLIWGADIGAYFAGRKWGQRKLLPEVSPGKTWAGFFGGSAAALVVALVAALLSGQRGSDLGYFLLVGLVVSWVSVVGDLVESLFKRRAGVKDSGTLLPGHGGVLDRIDSLTIAAPLFAVLMVAR